MINRKLNKLRIFMNIIKRIYAFPNKKLAIKLYMY